ncbi:sulfurtransferase [Marinobacterium nitratireducens]|uniref:Sulfurtransferase n=1 Tax=Marinobacterium nitratireducens TaxID=518897 RepID=A0A918DSF4_9GAMM|nr:sulfurtransferase [Marinobacterium nitratireducens]GGO82122.1 sulfurtransferase [Marinobacterium nitratireducens]
MYRTLVTAEQLRQHQDDWCLLDCRYSLADTGYGRRVYGEGHIPGAFYLDLDRDLSSPIGPRDGRHPLPDAAKLNERLRRCGVAPGVQVVVYDDCGGAMAARAWWLLRWLGHDVVAVLDGGYPAWLELGRTPECQAPRDRESDWQAQPDRAALVDVEAVEANLKAPVFTLVDARSGERFRGEQEPIDPVAGHIPGSLNRPLADNLEAGRFKSPAQLRREWLALLGEHPPEAVVHLCGSGVTACHNLLAMEHAGLGGARVYPGSWSEWIRDGRRPIATQIPDA